jgi:hypothetical protein
MGSNMQVRAFRRKYSSVQEADVFFVAECTLRRMLSVRDVLESDNDETFRLCITFHRKRAIFAVGTPFT